MDVEHTEVQFLGLFRIYQEACEIFFSLRKVFSQITLLLILPLAFFFIADINNVSDVFNHAKMIKNQLHLPDLRAGGQEYVKATDIISSEWTYLWQKRTHAYTLLVVFFTLSALAVVYNRAFINTGWEVSFKKLLTVRLIATFTCSFVAIFSYAMVSLTVFDKARFRGVIRIGSNAGIILYIVLMVLYLMGFFYLAIICHIVIVVSVFEEVFGIRAMMMINSMALDKGKIRASAFVFLRLIVSIMVIQLTIDMLVMHNLMKFRPNQPQTRSLYPAFAIIVGVAQDRTWNRLPQ